MPRPPSSWPLASRRSYLRTIAHPTKGTTFPAATLLLQLLRPPTRTRQPLLRTAVEAAIQPPLIPPKSNAVAQKRQEKHHCLTSLTTGPNVMLARIRKSDLQC